MHHHLTAVPAPTPVDDGSRTPASDPWLPVQQAVRDAADAPSAAAARGVLERAVAALRSTRPGEAPQAQLVLLSDVLRLLPPEERPAPPQVPAAAATDLELCTTPARPGDVLCLLRLSSAGGRAQAAAGMPELRARAVATVRSGDQVVVVDDLHLLVVMDGVSVPVAWRRMTGLVGERPRTGGEPVRLVHASVARVGPAGPGAALETAKGVLNRLSGGTAGWIVLAEDGPAAPDSPFAQGPRPAER